MRAGTAAGGAAAPTCSNSCTAAERCCGVAVTCWLACSVCSTCSTSVAIWGTQRSCDPLLSCTPPAASDAAPYDRLDREARGAGKCRDAECQSQIDELVGYCNAQGALVLESVQEGPGSFVLLRCTFGPWPPCHTPRDTLLGSLCTLPHPRHCQTAPRPWASAAPARWRRAGPPGAASGSRTRRAGPRRRCAPRACGRTPSTQSWSPSSSSCWPRAAASAG